MVIHFPSPKQDKWDEIEASWMLAVDEFPCPWRLREEAKKRIIEVIRSCREREKRSA